MLSNLYLFAFAIGKTAINCGFLPGVLLLAIARCPFPFCVLRDFHGDDHDVRVPIERFTPFREQAELFKSSGDGQLAHHFEFDSSEEVRFGATSPSRKVRRRA